MGDGGHSATSVAAAAVGATVVDAVAAVAAAADIAAAAAGKVVAAAAALDVVDENSWEAPFGEVDAVWGSADNDQSDGSPHQIWCSKRCHSSDNAMPDTLREYGVHYACYQNSSNKRAPQEYEGVFRLIQH